MQTVLDRHRAVLADRGILFPKIDAAQRMPKHQWLVPALCARSAAGLKVRIARTLAECQDNTHTVILTTEGLFNHWWDFSSAGRAALAALGSKFSVELWVWFREPVSFATSLYVQNLMALDPRPAKTYARDISIEDMLDDKWFARHFDYIGFVRDAERLLGQARVRPFAYGGSTVSEFLEALGVSDLAPSEPASENRTVGELGVSLLRTLNRYRLDTDQRLAAITKIVEIDAVAGKQSVPFRISAASGARIRALADESVHALERDYGLVLGQAWPSSLIPRRGPLAPAR